MKPIDTKGLIDLTEQVQTVGHIIFGLVAVVAVIAVIITSIVAGIQNSHEDDPQKRKQNNKKILWAGIVLILVIVGWGIFELVISIQASGGKTS